MLFRSDSKPNAPPVPAGRFFLSAVLLGHVQAGAGLDAAGGVLCRALAAQQLLGKIFLKFPWINTGNPRRWGRRGCFRYSQRKKRRERRVQPVLLSFVMNELMGDNAHKGNSHRSPLPFSKCLSQPPVHGKFTNRLLPPY